MRMDLISHSDENIRTDVRRARTSTAEIQLWHTSALSSTYPGEEYDILTDPQNCKLTVGAMARESRREILKSQHAVTKQSAVIWLRL